MEEEGEGGVLMRPRKGNEVEVIRGKVALGLHGSITVIREYFEINKQRTLSNVTL